MNPNILYQKVLIAPEKTKFCRNFFELEIAFLTSSSTILHLNKTVFDRIFSTFYEFSVAFLRTEKIKVYLKLLLK